MKYDRNHKCRFKENQIFMVEVVGIGVVEEDLCELGELMKQKGMK